MATRNGSSERGTIVTDRELKVLGVIVRALEALPDEPARARTMTYLRDRYGQLPLLASERPTS